MDTVVRVCTVQHVPKAVAYIAYQCKTRSSAIRRESAHGSILRCKRLFNMKPAWITSVTVHCDAICRMNIERQDANLESCGDFDSLRPVFSTLVQGEPLNSELRNLAPRN